MNARELKDGRKIAEFFSEILVLKTTTRTGWNVISAPRESIAEHIAITSQIAYVLAIMEGLNPEKCATMALFHDNEEVRIGDLHKIASLYLKKDKASRKAVRDQLSGLPAKIRQRISLLMKEERGQRTPEAIVVKDANWLETALCAKILEEKGYRTGKDWFEWIKGILRTESARKVFAEVEAIDGFTSVWWQAEKEEIMRNEQAKAA